MQLVHFLVDVLWLCAIAVGDPTIGKRKEEQDAKHNFHNTNVNNGNPEDGAKATHGVGVDYIAGARAKPQDMSTMTANPGGVMANLDELVEMLDREARKKTEVQDKTGRYDDRDDQCEDGICRVEDDAYMIPRDSTEYESMEEIPTAVLNNFETSLEEDMGTSRLESDRSDMIWGDSAGGIQTGDETDSVVTRDQYPTRSGEEQTRMRESPSSKFYHESPLPSHRRESKTQEASANIDGSASLRDRDSVDAHDHARDRRAEDTFPQDSKLARTESDAENALNRGAEIRGGSDTSGILGTRRSGILKHLGEERVRAGTGSEKKGISTSEEAKRGIESSVAAQPDNEGTVQEPGTIWKPAMGPAKIPIASHSSESLDTSAGITSKPASMWAASAVSGEGFVIGRNVAILDAPNAEAGEICICSCDECKTLEKEAYVEDILDTPVDLEQMLHLFPSPPGVSSFSEAYAYVKTVLSWSTLLLLALLHDAVVGIRSVYLSYWKKGLGLRPWHLLLMGNALIPALAFWWVRSEQRELRRAVVQLINENSCLDKDRKKAQCAVDHVSKEVQRLLGRPGVVSADGTAASSVLISLVEEMKSDISKHGAMMIDFQRQIGIIHSTVVRQLQQGGEHQERQLELQRLRQFLETMEQHGLVIDPHQFAVIYAMLLQIGTQLHAQINIPQEYASLLQKYGFDVAAYETETAYVGDSRFMHPAFVARDEGPTDHMKSYERRSMDLRESSYAPSQAVHGFQPQNEVVCGPFDT